MCISSPGVVCPKHTRTPRGQDPHAGVRQALVSGVWGPGMQTAPPPHLLCPGKIHSAHDF